MWLIAGYGICSSSLKAASLKLPHPTNKCIFCNCDILKIILSTIGAQGTGTKVLNTKIQCIPKEQPSNDGLTIKTSTLL